MEQNAKQLLKRISDKIGALTDKEISRVSHAPQEKEWRAYIAQKAPHWEDIAWRVKEPNSKGEAEIHLGFYTANPSEALNDAIEKAEALSKGKVNHVVKNENGIRLVWKENLNDSTALDKLYLNLEGLLNDFLVIAFDAICSNPEGLIKNDSSNENTEVESISQNQLEFLESKSYWDKDELPKEWVNSTAFLMEAVKKDGRWLEVASEKLKNDLELVSLALNENGCALEFVTDEIKRNKNFVLLAVSQDGTAIEFASAELKIDKEVIIKALSQNFYAINYLSSTVFEDLTLVNQIFLSLDENKYKDLFFRLPHNIRTEKNILELVQPIYKNACKWINEKSSTSFLNYLSYFDSQEPFSNEDNLPDFNDEYGIPLSNNHFESLKNQFQLLIFEIDNSNEAWEELGGSEQFTIIYDLSENRILPNKKQSPNEDDFSLIKRGQYLDSLYVGIYQPYIDNQRFEGSFSVSNYFDVKNKDENSFVISYHGEDVDDHSCDSDILGEISIAITPSSMYYFVTDVLRNF